jgi:hypothetical protein
MSACQSKPFTLHRDPWSQLVLTDEAGNVHVGIVPVRMFPFSDRSHWVSVLDAQGREITCIEDLAALDGSLRELLEEELGQREFIPSIRRIVHVSGDTEPCEWQVETDRGPTRFVLKSEDDVRRLAPYQSLVIDATGMRYLVPDVRKLDPYSRRVMEEYA